MKLKQILFIVFIPICGFLAYLIYSSIRDKELNMKKTELAERAIKDQLNFLKEVQILYFNKYNTYADTWKDLEDFIKSDSLYITEKKEEVITLYYGADSISVSIDTLGSVAVADSLYNTIDQELVTHPDSLSLIPFSGKEFSLKTGSVDGLDVFEIKDIDPINERRKLGISGFDTLRMGSLKNAALKGNWEK